MTNQQKRRNLDTSFKLQDVQMVKQQGLSVGDVRKDMQLGETAVWRWVTQFEAKQSGLPSVGKPLTPQQQRIRQFESENHQLKGNIDILKKRRPSLRGNCDEPSTSSSVAKVGRNSDHILPRAATEPFRVLWRSQSCIDDTQGVRYLSHPGDQSPVQRKKSGSLE